MRISDWSSDVCSSDLRGDGGAGGILDAHALVQVLAVPRDDEQRVVDAHAEADHGAEDEGELGDVEHRSQDADASGADEDAEKRGGDREPRSEEHTSELQSLMRISYAVFCLQKKKTKIQ